MDIRKLILMVGALAFAAVCAVMARNLFAGSSAPKAAVILPAPQPTGPEVLVAVRTLPVGTILGPDAFRYQPWPKDLVQNAYFVKGGGTAAATLQGTVVRYAITAGQPITQGSLIKPGDRGFLAAALGPGMRAVTIAVSQQTGVAGFVFPGDRVDLLLTQTIAGGGEGQPLKAAETIMRNLRVLATDQRTDKTTDENGKTQVTTFSNVTLETTPKLSEKIAVAQTLGSLSLSLRSIADDSMELERAIAAGEVNVPDSTDPKATQAMMLQVASRPVDGGTFATGGDVSRFQRSTVPGKPAEAGQPAAPATPAGARPPEFAGVTVIRGGGAASVVPVSAAPATPTPANAAPAGSN